MNWIEYDRQMKLERQLQSVHREENFTNLEPSIAGNRYMYYYKSVREGQRRYRERKKLDA